jgi:tetratricopeptide (TPR) repeat protein
LIIVEKDNALVQFEMALTYDAMSREREAIPYYEHAISLGLPGELKSSALLCLGSSYRNIGQTEKAKDVLLTAIEEYPDHIGMRCFYALAQNSAGEVGDAARTLMDAILLISPESVKPFQKSLNSYREEFR